MALDSNIVPMPSFSLRVKVVMYLPIEQLRPPLLNSVIYRCGIHIPMGITHNSPLQQFR